MSERNPISEGESVRASDFFYRVMNAWWKGTLAEERDALLVHPGSAPFFRCAEGYAYGWWLRDLIQNASPLMAGFTISWQEVSN